VPRFVIKGGVPLCGTVRVSGAKNAVLPMLASTILNPHPCEIRGVPQLRDVEVMIGLLRALGVKVDGPDEDGVVRVDAGNIDTYEVDERLTREMRSSIFLMGPLLGRMGSVKIAYPGGCAIGPRPIDFHLKGLEALGVNIKEQSGFINASTRGMVGADIHLDFPSVGATENIMMAAVLAKGTTIIRNAAKEPEIIDLQNFLNGMGARIKGAGMDTIRVEGVSLEDFRPVSHMVIPDRIEAGTFLAMVAATGGEVTLRNIIPEHVEAVVHKLREAGVRIQYADDGLTVIATRRPTAVDFKTLPYPGFPTDMQPQMMALMSIADGTSIITETVFESRFAVAAELRRMGGQIKTEGRTAVVKGVERLSGATVTASDLRSGVALVLAGLVATGCTVVEGVHHIQRGYELLDSKLRGLGARIELE